MQRNATSARWRSPGIRSRVTLAALAIVTATLVGSGIALVLLVQQSLVASLDSAALARAQDVASLATSGGLQSVVPNTGEENALVQVVDASGAVVAATGNVEGQSAILSSPPASQATSVMTLGQLALGDGQYRVVAEPVHLKTGQGWIYVATSLAQVNTAVGSLTTLFALGLPLVLLIVALAMWRAAGQVLRPVDEIRKRASVIGGADLSQRVPVPNSTDEIARLAVTMNEMLQRLETSARRQRQFVGDASHELRSPLAALRAQVDVALAHPEDPGSARVLGSVQDQVSRMSTLVDDLLFLARSAESAPRSVAGTVDLDELVLGEVHRLREAGGPTVELVGVRAARVSGSERDLARMLRNLTENAREHANSEVALQLTLTDEFAEIVVIDDGSGIREEDRERVFERFTRLDDARTRSARGGGAGVGLSIARQVARDHGGSIVVTGRQDGASGAAFVVRLPMEAK
jgi:signal transduction histidine kinase